jgi:SAM-dependent methyltransferase
LLCGVIALDLGPNVFRAKIQSMDINGWNERYRCQARPDEDFSAEPTRLLTQTASELNPGSALDLACGTGRNALWLAEHGWRVAAVDGAEAAIAMLRDRASISGLDIDARTADLTKGEYQIEPEAWDLIAICYYLQRDLFEPAKRGLAEGGVLVAIVHIAAQGEAPTEHRLAPGELLRYFEGLEILHHYEGMPNDAAHRRTVAEVVARRVTRQPGPVCSDDSEGFAALS